MKKAFLGVLSAAIVFSIYVTTAFAAGPGGGRYFVDADRDGICDNAGSRCAYVDEDGLCNVCGTEHKICLTRDGAAFADADGDGICDNCGTYHWCGGNFVDEDDDGVCDNYTAGHGQGWGCGKRRGGQGCWGR